MRRSIRERAIRILLSSIIGSDLRPTEIRAIAEGFLNEPDFCKEIGFMMMDIVSRMGQTSRKVDSGVAIGPAKRKSVFVSKSLSIINSRRLSKKNVLAMMRMLAPQMGNLEGITSRTVKEILELFENYASVSSKDKLVRWLKPGLTKSDRDPDKLTLEWALSLSKKRQLSKKDIIVKLKELSSEIEDLCRGDRLSIREVLAIFMEGSSPQNIQIFMSWLENGAVSSDEYLKGIMGEQ